MPVRYILLLIFLSQALIGTSVARQYAAMIVNEENGAVLHAENPDVKTHPASLAKMMTLYLVFEKLKSGDLKLSQRIPVSRTAAKRPSSRLGLKKGQLISVQDAIRALIIKSANDVATVIAEAISGDEIRFANLMTIRAHQLGMTATIFKNASGLPDKSQITTARDMVRLSIALRQNFPEYFDLFKETTFKYGRKRFRNHNNLLRRLKGITGIKTGYINNSGYNLAVSFEKDGKRLIGVIFGGKTSARRDNRMIRLLRRAIKMATEHDRLVRHNKKNMSKFSASQTGLRKLPSISLPNSTRNSGPWAVQVGAFSELGKADEANKIASKTVTALEEAKAIISRDYLDGKVVYKARFIEMREGQAIGACRALAVRNIPCQIIKMGRPSQPTK
jgi:D-alanyl-D-alanine carboxypeptidase